MHRALENDRVGNTRVAQRVHCFSIPGGMWTGRRMGNQPSKSKLTPLALALALALAGESIYETEPGLPYEDYLDGGEGNDELRGVNGADILLGGAGDDLLVGGIAIESTWKEAA